MVPPGEGEPFPEDRYDWMLVTDDMIDRVAHLAADSARSAALKEMLHERNIFLDWERYGRFSYVILDPDAPASIRNRSVAFDLERGGRGSIAECELKPLSAKQRIARRFGRVVEPEIVMTGSTRPLYKSQAEDLITHLESIQGPPDVSE